MRSVRAAMLFSLASAAALFANPAEFWLDLVSGEEAAPAEVFADLAQADVVYVGEAHTIDRHHAVQLGVLQELHARGRSLTLCMEQLEARDQPTIDRFNSGALTFEQLATEMNWAKKWKNYADYRALCEFAQQNGIPLRALNAPPEVIRAVSRDGGLAKLPSAQRATLPAKIHLDDEPYSRVLDEELSVHMAMEPTKLRSAIEAQIARDETMAANIIQILTDLPVKLQGRHTAVVIIGSGHVRYGLGTPARVHYRRRAVADRIVLSTESGQLKLSESDKAAMRSSSLSRNTLRWINRPPGDYLRVLPLAAAEPEKKQPTQ